jgi:dUTP pyrophosphatase
MNYKEDYKTDDPAWYQPVPDFNFKTNLEVKFYRCHPNAKLPERANFDDAGWDLFLSEDVEIRAHTPTLLPTGLKMVIPSGWEAQVRPRSGMSLKGWKVCNSPGTIDAGYRGEIKVIMSSPEDQLLPMVLHTGTKIAQLVFKRVPQVSVNEISLEEFETLSNTSRGSGGFGSTGK